MPESGPPSEPGLPPRASEAGGDGPVSSHGAGQKTLEPEAESPGSQKSEPPPAPAAQAPLSHIPFADPASAHALFARIAERVSHGLAASLPSLLAESPDPDSSLILLDRMLESSTEITRLLNQHYFLAHYALLVFGHSRFLGETLLQNPDLLSSFLRDRNLDRSFSREEFHESLARFRSRSFETDVSYLLARFKRREYVRIMLRDVLKIAPLAETTAEISALSDVLIEDALRAAESMMQHRYAPPGHLDAAGRLVNTPFAVLSLGKLGGNELNYSSDVDLLYIFGDGQEPPEAQISNREYFVRLAQQVTEILCRTSREGAVFRIDLRLRPQGNEGELAISLSRALQYYAESAHDWERQALIKVRYSAGDESLAREFIRGVQPHVYTEGINFAAIKTALVAREKMHARRYHRKTIEPGASTDIKVDHGGIRDIEFLVQCLQRVYGGKEPWLRSGGTLFSLQKLHDKRHISGKDFHELTSAYEFLRHLEHRLQLRQGQQTHRLPASQREMRILQRSMEGYAPGVYRLAELAGVVHSRMEAVAEIYWRIIYQQQMRGHHEAPDAEFQLRPPLDPALADQSGQQLLERIAADAPSIYESLLLDAKSPQACKNLLRFLSSAFTSSERYATVLRNATAIRRALTVFECSDYLTDILVRHPEEIATLADWEDVSPPRGAGYLFEGLLEPRQMAGDPIFAFLAASPGSHSEKLLLLRQHYRRRVFASGALDINEPRAPYESFASTTAAAEDALAAAFEIAGAPQGLAVMAVGRLGSGEFDVLSDADLLFVCEEGQDRFALAKAVGRMVQALAAYTQEGMVFSVDTRLRPRGGEGELLVTPVQLASYCEQEAQSWEALMFTKMRFLAGEAQLGKRALAAAKILFERMAAAAKFVQDAQEMRLRLETSEVPGKSLKTSPGALYDVDFLTGYLMVKEQIAEKGGTLRDRLWRCAAAGVLNKTDAAALDHATELMHTAQHVARLVVGRPLRWLPGTEHARKVTEKLTAQILGRNLPDGLETEILGTLQLVRGIYERILGPPAKG